MNHDYFELQQFLAGYFNQDRAEDHENASEVIDFFISEADTSTITKVLTEIDKLILSKNTEQELGNYLFKNIGCYYYYRDEWKNGKAWLRHISSTLKTPRHQNK